ncbi:MAG: CBS domain-containing protein [Dehalobacterium sp.]
MITVSNVFMSFTVEPILVHQNEKIKSIHQKFIMQKKPICRCAYVIDDDKQVVGRITLRKVMNYVAINKALTGSRPYSVKTLFQYISPDLTAENIMGPAIIVGIDQPLEEAFQLMLDKNAEEVAVVDNDGYVIGDLNIYEVLKEMKID